MRFGKIITYIVCSLFDVRIISVYVYMQPRVIFIRKVAINKPLNDISRYEGERGGGGKKLRNTFQRLRPEEFSSGDSAGDFGLRSNILRMCS